MEPLKEMFNKEFYARLAGEFCRVEKKFDSKGFIKDVITGLEGLELNQRMRQTSVVLKKHLPDDFEKSVGIMKNVIPQIKAGYANLVFPDFVALYGKENVDVSLEALKYFTCFGSSEFAIREFMRLDFDKTIAVMQDWAGDKNHHVRRLASEGSRPRLPWSFKLDRVIENPKLTLRILETLKDDKELYVKKSVANHLNDISKDHPEFLLEIIEKWKGRSPHTDWILKHAGRSLLKKGNAKALAHFGIKYNPSLICNGFKIAERQVKIGRKLNFAFTLNNSGGKPVNTRIEYAIYFKLAGGALSKKVFKISERELGPGQKIILQKAHDFKHISTRKYYPGKQKISLIINGKELSPLGFELE